MPPAEPPYGRVFGDHRVVEGGAVRQGSIGLLYDAVHVRTGRPAVIKLLRPEWLAHPVARRRFQEEGEAAVRIRHPGVVAVLDAGDADGVPYLVLERLEGENLRERLRAAGPLEGERVLDIARQLSRALVAVHASGVVHRDIKPENLFLVAEPELPGGERVVLVDFGIAKPKERPDAFATHQGAQFGTEPYMAPEQWRDPSGSDARTDLYAVGCVLYELLAGEPPFGVTGNLGEAHARQAPPALPRDVSPALAHVVLRLLEKEPTARYESAEALLQALERAGRDEASERMLAAPAATQAAPGPASPWTRSLVLAAAAGFVLGGLVVGTLVALLSP